ncbi:hypothetical protein RJ639_046454 [Escallonia herrerae]|uniref:Cucumisin n=1 Tax=Escallonia herrerae TaxID=1293975 RepID=A0AA88WI87_9ASTE|nr:hypothetical protein RJ639_046454 [Escallonia herrerae]
MSSGILPFPFMFTLCTWEPNLKENIHLRLITPACFKKLLISGKKHSQSLVRSYTRSFNGFAAYLTDQERQRMASLDGVVSVFPSRTLQPQTTRSWDFVGMSENVLRNPTMESDVIVGVIDTGIWPESESFTDEGLGPAPLKWKGACKGGTNFTCNNKLIGARYYLSYDEPSERSARDTRGHGTHTASTIAGNNVKNASFYGLLQGTARGGVPSARIAAYKVCHPLGCLENDILAAFDDAIADGVDIITISVGGNAAEELFSDSIAIGSFHAMERGILTVNSAGNNGFQAGSVSSVAPWMLTVAASTIDRRVVDKAILGNGETFLGNAVNPFMFNGEKYPLAYGKDVTSSCDESNAGLCIEECLDKDLVKGKIVLCHNNHGTVTAKKAGALGSIVPFGEAYDTSFVVSSPTAVLSFPDIRLIHSYINSTKNPQAGISKSEAIRDFDAPVVASFSSKGPNTIVPDILKVELHFLRLPARYNSTRPWRMNATKNPEAEFAYGAGHIDPVKATNPGLVYDALKEDYIQMLCNLMHDNTKLRNLTGDISSCSKATNGSPKDLNHASMAAQVGETKPFRVEFPRTVTNVGVPNSAYRATISKPSQLRISVEPSILSFKSQNEKKSFVVTVSGQGFGSMASASLVWSDGNHSVRSPIVLYTHSAFVA